MIRTLDRYVFKEMFVPLLIGTVSVVLMFLANTLIHYAGSVFRKEIPIEAILQFLVFKIPSTLNMTLPVGIIVASSLAVSRLSRESELTAMRAAGIPIRRVIFPILIVGLAVSCLSFWLSENVTPKAEARATKTLRNIFASGEAIGLQSRVLLKLNNGEYHLSIGTVQKGAGGLIQMSEVLVFHKPRLGEDWFAQAKTASYSQGIFTLDNPVIRQVRGEREIVYRPEKHIINVRVSLDDYFGAALPETMNAGQLLASINTWKSRGQDTRTIEVDYHSKFAIPAACLVFALFAPVFALWFSRGSVAFIGVLVSIIIVFLYYNVWILSSQVLAKQGILPPLVGAWLPNVLFAILGLVALWRVE